MAEIKVTDSVNVIEIVQRGLKGNTGDSSLTANPVDVVASGDISATSGTGSFGRVICTTISASTGQFDANTIFIGGESFFKETLLN